MYASANHTGSLAVVPSGCTIRIGHLESETARMLCDDLGVHEGEEVQCLGGTPNWMLCRVDDRRSVMMPRGFAAFVPVVPPAA